MAGEHVRLLTTYGWVVASLVLARWAWSPPGGSLGALVGAVLGLANFFIEGGKTFSLAVLAAYPTAVIGAGVGSVAQLLWRKIIGRRSPRPQPTFARVTKRAKWAAIGFGLAGLLMGFGWLYRPYSAGWIEISGAAVNSFPYGLFFSFMGGALAALVCWARPERPRSAQPA